MRELNDIYLDVRRRLMEAGSSSATLEARELCAYALGMDRNAFLSNLGLFLTEESENKIWSLFERRMDGEPLAQIIGEWEFYSLPFLITRDVLIPRADTETLVEAAIAFSRQRGAPRVLDLCCGSGCIGIAIAKNISEARVTLADLSEKALAVARENIKRNAASQNTAALAWNVLSGWRPILGKFDLIVCNPPYIPSDEIAQLDCDVRDYEPRLALDGGDDGLTFYRALASLWKEALAPGGRMMVECGIGQHTAIASIFAQADFTAAEILCDLMGIERVVSVGLPPAREEDAPASAPDAQQAGEPPGDETADVTEQGADAKIQ